MSLLQSPRSTGNKSTKSKPALIVVDVQRDFCPGGALPVRHGDEIIIPMNRMIALFEERGLPIFFTRDWHPSDHRSFGSRGGPWPVHCVKETEGARFHDSLLVPKDSTIISKGTKRDAEAYSGFQGTDLAERLRGMKVDELYVVGLATDYCVKNTVLDGLDKGFKVEVVSDCVRGVNVRRTDSANAFGEMVARGAKKTTSDDVLGAISRRVAVSSSS